MAMDAYGQSVAISLSTLVLVLDCGSSGVMIKTRETWGYYNMIYILGLSVYPITSNSG